MFRKINKHVIIICILGILGKVVYVVYTKISWQGLELNLALLSTVLQSIINRLCKAKFSNGIDYYSLSV